MMHEPVLLAETLELLNLKSGSRCLDATVGSGGHSSGILRRIAPGGCLIGIDRDEEALRRTRERLAGEEGGSLILRHGNHADLAGIARAAGMEAADAILIDCGVSLEQLTTPGRGFSFQDDGPLDMRMDRSQGATAAELVSRLDESELTALIGTLGEEPAARRVARAIVAERRAMPLDGTRRLAELVERALGGRRGRIHPATRTFQALRMAVNRELESLQSALDGAIGLLAAGGRLAVISFHSGEDRLVKRTFSEHVGRWEALQAGGEKWRGALPPVKWVCRKPLMASEDEVARNPRSRSAKLRVVERVPDDSVGF
jgi:16S rRNA (cytosine1402-N4)-methyltransferase